MSEPVPQDDRWTRAGTLRAALIALFCLGAGAGLGTCIAHEPAAPEGAAPPEVKVAAAGEVELAVVAPLRVGAKLGDFEIREIRELHEGTIALVCARGDAVVRLDVARVGGEASAPASAGPYAVFYSAVKGASNEEAAALAQALADVVGKNAGALPAELAPFTPAACEVSL